MHFWDTLKEVLQCGIKGIAFLLGFFKAMQYPSNCQKIRYGTQTISRISRMGYCTFIKYFAL
jgi:hypothetical protein